MPTGTKLLPSTYERLMEMASSVGNHPACLRIVEGIL